MDSLPALRSRQLATLWQTTDSLDSTVGLGRRLFVRCVLQFVSCYFILKLRCFQIPFTSIQFPLYEYFKVRAAKYLGRDKLPAHEAAVCGSVAGGIAAALTTPLDVLKTRTMLDVRVSSLSCIFSILSDDRA